MADKGQSVGRTAEGQAVFVENAAPGDVVDVRVKKKKHGYYTGIVENFLHYSEDRVAAQCAHFGVCGGCKWQHIDYQSQLHHKNQIVLDALTRIGKLTPQEFLPILGAPDIYFYRNKLEFTFSNRRWLSQEEMTAGDDAFVPALGFHRPGLFDKIIDLQTCWLQADPSNEIRLGIKEIALRQGLSFYDPKAQKGFMRNVVFRITTLGEILLLFSFGEKDTAAIHDFLQEVQNRFPKITTLVYCVNTKVNDFVLDLDMVTFSGKGFVMEKIGPVYCQIGPKSFFQTNTLQAEKLYSVAADFADLTGQENVYDLYTGLGSIALYIAKNCKQVVGIEEVEAAIEDAKINANINDIRNAKFYAGDVKDILSTDFALEHGKPDVLITDPPRAGMHPDVINILLELESPRIVYVSCNPATQARDLQLLSTKYDLIKVQPVDMFPHTSHIESVALVKLKGTE